jgi:hypothetical protein
VELLVALIVTGVRVGVAVDGLECPLSVLELNLLLLVALGGNLLLAFPLLGRCAVTPRLLLLLLVELLYELLDLPALLYVVVPRVVYQAPWTTLVIAGGPPQPLVTTWPHPPPAAAAAAATVGASASGLLLLLLPPSFFFFMFLFLPLL